jgi:phosphatidylserine decarboxylase
MYDIDDAYAGAKATGSPSLSPRRRARFGSRLKEFDRSWMAISRLDPADYRRFHCPMDGETTAESYRILHSECRINNHTDHLMA